MKRILTIIMVYLALSLATPTFGKGVEHPQPRDEFIYSYFSQVIVRWEYSLNYALEGNPYSIQLANFTLAELAKIRAEGEYYESIGVHSRVMEVLPPFYDFSENLVTLDRLILTLKENPTPPIARATLATISKMESDLNTIESLNLRNGTETLTFDVKNIRKLLEQVKELASTVPPSENFTIWVSNDHPWVGQVITISGYTPYKGSVSVIVEIGYYATIIPVQPENGTFSTTYRFQKAGVYKVFAFSRGRKSNVVTVNVTRIPVYFIVDDVYRGVIGENVTVKGVLIDAFGRAMGNKTIYANESPVLTGADGGFSFTVTSNKTGKVPLTLTFEGDETHRSAEKNITIEFSRYRLSLFLNGPSSTEVGKELKFEGRLSANISIPLTVYVNGTQYTQILAKNGRFEFTIKAEKKGVMKVFVEFKGNELYSPARSNIVTVVVTEGGIPWDKYIVLLILSITLTALYLTRGNRQEEEMPLIIENETPEVEIRKIPEIPNDIGDAFEFLLRVMSEKLHIPRGLTPREILQELTDWEYKDILSKVIRIHEKTVYGGTKISDAEKKEFFSAIRKLLEVLA